VRSGQSSVGDRQCENSLEIFHSHPTRLVCPSTTPPGAVRCLPPATCPLFCECTNPIRSLYTTLPTYYSTLILTPHHSSLLPAACLPLTFRPLTSAISPQADGNFNFNPPKPSTQLVDIQNTPPAPINNFKLLLLPPLRLHLFTTRATTHDNASLRSCSCLALPLYAPCRWRQLKPPETRQCPLETFLFRTLPPPSVYLYTLSRNTAAPQSSPPHHTICNRESWPQAQTCLTAPSPPMA
jgi:hypothetical protein